MTTYYVDKAAADGGNGSESTPWNTLAAAVAVATTGDTVRVAAGTYTGAGVAIKYREAEFAT